MSEAREGVNPLRPYHIPTPAVPSLSDPGPSPSRSALGHHVATTALPKSTGLRSSARDMLPDLSTDYNDYLPDASPPLAELLRSLLDRGLWRYTSVFLAQPFELAKTILQVQDAGAVTDGVVEERSVQRRRDRLEQGYGYERGHKNGYSDDDSDEDSEAYFTSAAPVPHTSRGRRRYTSRSPSPPPPRRTADPRATLTSASSITAVHAYLWSTEGALGVWKGTNPTFLYTVLLSTLTTLLRSLFCAALALPDPALAPGGPAVLPTLPRLDILSSPAPALALGASVAASAFSALILVPLYTVRTYLLLTPSQAPQDISSRPPQKTPTRSLLPLLRALPSYLPLPLAVPTLLHAALPTLAAALAPPFLRSRLGLDPGRAPVLHAAALATAQCTELALRLPVETMLRRGQMHAVLRAADATSSVEKRGVGNGTAVVGRQTVVPIGRYAGLFGTMHHVLFEEGSRPLEAPTAKEKGKLTQERGPSERRRKGQGMPGLWRGWRVGVWGLVGVWGASIVGAGTRGGEF